MTELFSYKNGNCDITIFSDGTKTREFNETPLLLFPESMDVKITNFCNLAKICTYCHEQSNLLGKHADISVLINKLSELPKVGIELAIGGGNPLDHPNLVDLLQFCKDNNFIPNVTVNQLHLKKNQQFIEDLISRDLIKGLGISYRNSKEQLYFADYEHIVIHLIAGINTTNELDELIEKGFNKFLILGYKTFGNGIEFYNSNKSEIDDNIQFWYMFISKYIGKITLSFDNLAIEQLNIKRLFTNSGWSKFFMGEDFSHTMYIDAVNQEFSPTSRNSNRESFNDYSIQDYFQKFRTKFL